MLAGQLHGATSLREKLLPFIAIAQTVAVRDGRLRSAGKAAVRPVLIMPSGPG
ncbi:hypothetical protein [Janthinobacterium sp. AD80]|uniref:hypothetical protein n=1 Tax=Janthinobacterium sp. AD80 TaxID=1528773 RepID=UPI0015E0993D|nr:hypothetical protein [Janthinobacterium sp. AD80]